MHLFVTGAYRSGTTLVEKLLHQHPAASVASQPFPFLYANVKQSFLDELGITERYPLGHCFRAAYRPAQWWAFLDRHLIPGDRLDRWIAEQQGYSGHWTPELASLAGELEGGTFLEVHERMQARLAEALGGRRAHVRGSKEILCEEYIPHLLAAGQRVVLVLRDVRAVLASLLGGQGHRYGGEARPVLFTIRVWRKSVAYALAFEDHPGLRTVRYEDLVTDRRRTLDALGDWLDLPADAGWTGHDVVDQRGRPWQANSSFTRPSEGVADQWERICSIVPAPTIRYAEACAYPELLASGYPVEPPQPQALEEFREPVAITRAEFDPRYSTRPGHLTEERERLCMLSADLPQDDARRWFLFPRAHAALSAAVRQSEVGPGGGSHSGAPPAQPA